jgi:EAL domain-containing protein (putative c-di-GMP-specific phosphodiesterase class I)/CheY-like chemotaxis protein
MVMAKPIRVLVADDEPNVRAALTELVNVDPSLQLVGIAGGATDAVSLAQSTQPDIAVLDVRMSGGGGVAAARGIRRVSPHTRILAWSAYSDRGPVVEMLRAGAVGYVVKGSSASQILEAIAETARGEATFSGEVTHGLAAELVEHFGRTRARREADELRLARVREALEGGEPNMVVQPIVDLKTGVVSGFEALARFSAGPVRAPDVWFADAHEVGLGVELELAAIRTALNFINDLPAPTFLCLNASPTTVMSEDLLRVLRAHEGDRLVVEMTEHARVQDYGALLKALVDLRGHGIRISVDDAGAGFASLRHILQLLPEFIKLDASLTRGIDSNLAKRALARGLISFADEIGINVVGEGVENVSELEALRELGVGFAQGFHLGRPGPAPGRPNG